MRKMVNVVIIKMVHVSFLEEGRYPDNANVLSILSY